MGVEIRETEVGVGESVCEVADDGLSRKVFCVEWCSEGTKFEEVTEGFPMSYFRLRVTMICFRKY